MHPAGGGADGNPIKCHSHLFKTSLVPRTIASRTKNDENKVWQTYIDSKCVVGSVDGSPVVDRGLETGFYLPVLDEILDQVGETSSFMGFCFGYVLSGKVSLAAKREIEWMRWVMVKTYLSRKPCVC